MGTQNEIAAAAAVDLSEVFGETLSKNARPEILDEVRGLHAIFAKTRDDRDWCRYAFMLDWAAEARDLRGVRIWSRDYERSGVISGASILSRGGSSLGVLVTVERDYDTLPEVEVLEFVLAAVDDHTACLLPPGVVRPPTGSCLEITLGTLRRLPPAPPLEGEFGSGLWRVWYGECSAPPAGCELPLPSRRSEGARIG
jgi:hypothetical protein